MSFGPRFVCHGPEPARLPPTAFCALPPAQGKAGGGGEQKEDAPLPNHTTALEVVSKFLGSSFQGVRPPASS